MKLQEMLASVGASVQQAQRYLEDNAVNTFFKQYFNREAVENMDSAKPSWTPKTQPVTLIRPGGESAKIDVPVLTLVNHDVMGLEEVKVKLRLDLEENDKTGELYARAACCDGSVGAHEVELTFQRHVETEGAARVTQETIDRML